MAYAESGALMDTSAREVSARNNQLEEDRLASLMRSGVGMTVFQRGNYANSN